jgi:hypothetical protein
MSVPSRNAAIYCVTDSPDRCWRRVNCARLKIVLAGCPKCVVKRVTASSYASLGFVVSEVYIRNPSVPRLARKIAAFRGAMASVSGKTIVRSQSSNIASHRCHGIGGQPGGCRNGGRWVMSTHIRRPKRQASPQTSQSTTQRRATSRTYTQDDR